MACDWLLKWPALEAIQRARPQTVRAFFLRAQLAAAPRTSARRRRHRRRQVAYAGRGGSRRPAADGPDVLAKQLRLLHHSIVEYERQIAALFRPHPDAFLFGSLPGAGEVIAPRLLTAFGTDRSRHPTAQDTQTYAGIAPVVERSGKSCWTHWRWNCPKFLRQTFHEVLAKNSIPYSAWAKAYYDQQKSRGKGHNAAIRALAFKWVRIIHRCWRRPHALRRRPLPPGPHAARIAALRPHRRACPGGLKESEI